MLWLPLLWGCNGGNHASGGEVVASFGKEELTREVLNNLTPDGLPPADSARYAQKFIQQWLEDHAVAEAAREKIPDLDARIAEPLRQYGQDLITQAYFEWLVNAEGAIAPLTPEDIRAYYQEFPEKFVTDRSYYAFFHVVTLRKDPWKVRSMLKSRSEADIEALATWSSDSAFTYKLDSLYVTESELVGAGAGYRYGDIRKAEKGVVYDYEHTQNDTTYYHFFKLLAVLKPGEQMPISLCKDKISSIILNQRQRALFEQTRQELLEKAEREKRYQLFTQ